MIYELDVSNVADYLQEQGVASSADVTAVELLGWGISNTLVKVYTINDCFVVKQALPKLRVSEDWFADRERIFQERACIDTLAGVLPTGTIPLIRYEDQDSFLYVMSCAPATSVNWKEQLLAGKVDPLVSGKVGALLGTIHRATGDNELIHQDFADDHPLVQLRIEPYHRTIAKLHSELAGIINREAQRMLEVKTALVHGDYSPKNILVNGQEIFLLDFEVAHYGNPVFDTAFMLNHLLLKSIHNSPMRTAYFEAARTFWQEYLREIGEDSRSISPDEERHTVKQTGCLMLARVDGKSPAEYIVAPEVKQIVRSIARTLLVDEISTLAEMIELVDSRVTRANHSHQNTV